MRPLKNLCEIAVVGGGMAGLAAAHHAARLGRLVTLFEGSGLYGGQVATVAHVDGLPTAGPVSGQDVAIPLLEQARKIGVRVVEAGVAAIEAGERLTLADEEGGIHQPDAIVLASGASLRRLGVPGEEAFAGRGVSRCATCDGGFFRRDAVAVVGGGDSAVQEALVLADTCRQVMLVSRGPLRAKRDYVDRLAAKENVRFAWDSEVVEIVGDTVVTGVRVRDRRTGAEAEIACAGIFPYIGVVPNSGFVPAALVDERGLVPTGAGHASADPRILAVGAVRADYGGQLVQAVAEGVGAAEAAAALLAAPRQRAAA